MLFSISNLPVDHPFGFVVAFSVCLMQCCIFGCANSFQVYFQQMMADPSLQSPSLSQLSWTAAFIMGASPLIGIVAGDLYDRFPTNVLMIAAILIAAAGMWLTAMFATSPILLVVFFGVPFATCAALILAPGYGAVTTWFTKHRSTAVGIASSGSGVGSCIFPPIVGILTEKYGWRRTSEMLTLLLIPGLVAAALVSKRNSPRQSRGYSIIEDVDTHDPVVTRASTTPGMSTRSIHTDRVHFRQLLREVRKPLFLSHFVAYMLAFIGFYSSLFLIVPLTTSMGIPGSPYEGTPVITNIRASQLLVYFGVAQVVGAIGIGFIAAHCGLVAVYMVTCAGGGLASCLLALCRTYAQFAVCMGALGFTVSGIVATYPSIIVRSYHGPNLGILLSLVQLGTCISGAAAPLTQSLLMEAVGGDYSYGCILMGLALCGSALVCFLGIGFFHEDDVHKKAPAAKLKEGEDA